MRPPRRTPVGTGPAPPAIRHVPLDVQGPPAYLAATANAVCRYLLCLRDATGRNRTVPVAITGRLGLAGHPVYADQDGTVQVEPAALGGRGDVVRATMTISNGMNVTKNSAANAIER
ncbi:DUF6296 family protein [Kitasatospora sp. NPDC018058]|uniref:DUF6296 family protein n=1 Tax=Kitasatospora sp. NPDC018058 TaxID=3364025 RepID=UPI0037C066BE